MCTRFDRSWCGLFGRFLGPIFWFTSFYSWVDHWVFSAHLLPLLYQQLLKFSEEKWVTIQKVQWLSLFGHTSAQIKSMGGFFNFNIEMKWVFLAKSTVRRARGTGFVPRSSIDPSIAGNWSRYNLCDIVIKASVAFVASTAPDHVHFKCCISADTGPSTHQHAWIL